MLANRHDAGLDQVAAMLRDQRKAMLRAQANYRKRNDVWWTVPRNLRVLVLWAIRGSANLEEAERVVGYITAKPWNYRAEWVAARCREMDGKR